MEELRCKKCESILDPDGVVEDLAIARCLNCNAVFSLKPGGGDATSDVVRPKVPMPQGIEVLEHMSVLQIRRKWYTPVLWAALFFCIFWNGFMIVWHTMAFSMGAWFMSLFGLLHTGVGVYVAYWVLAGFLNTTVIHAGMGVLEIDHQPVPWPGKKSIPTNQLAQIYCKQDIAHRRRSTRITYEVMAVRQDDESSIALLKGLDEPEQALYIEQELERFLEIADHRVAGDYR